MLTPEEKRARLSAVRKGKRTGKDNPFYGKTHTPEVRERIAKAASAFHSGEGHWNWQGGITPEKNSIRRSVKYKTWRLAIFERDDYTCRGCGARGVHLEAHHIKSFSEHPDLRFVVDNGITYCQKCHAKNDQHRAKFIKE